GSLLSFLESESAVVQAMDTVMDPTVVPGTVQVRIGTENALPDLAECSLVSASYGRGGQIMGEIAVLGPTRLDYAAAVSAVRTVAERLSDTLSSRFTF
ncbi:MAG: heat-inducible transcriptional repressor HrcA, partial [Cyanobacteria bacterium REEB65]|nr:heat-inducible transcriptional repressor HrcA [Cyanobacteria bacterium REEB65]